jgi:hypothetical protein
MGFWKTLFGIPDLPKTEEGQASSPSPPPNPSPALPGPAIITRSFPESGEEIREVGRYLLGMFTAGERTRETNRKSAGFFLIRSIMETGWPKRSDAVHIQRFRDELKSAGLPLDVFSQDELTKLITAYYSFFELPGTILEFMAKMKIDVSGTPLLGPVSKELISVGDIFQSRTRMFLAAIESGLFTHGRRREIGLDVYVGYVSDTWVFGVEGQLSPTTAFSKVLEAYDRDQRANPNRLW